MRPSRAISRLWLAVLLLAAPALSQTTGNLFGRVIDEAGAPIPGALVEVKSDSLIRPQQTSSLPDGVFRLPLLPPGAYSVLARLTGFKDAVLDDVRVPLGETVTVTMTLTLGAEASVTVTSEAATASAFDVTSARLGITVTENMLASLPLGRNYASAAILVPGVATDIRGPTFYGASSLENSYVVDGVNTTGLRRGGQGKNLPLDFVQEVEIRSGGYEAEFGKALGGSINVITKAGGNDYHGNVFGYYDSESLGAPDEHESDRAAVGASILEVPRRYDVGLSLGGPVVRDRLWFFGAYDRAQSDQGYQATVQKIYSSTGSVIDRTVEDRNEQRTGNLFAMNLSWAPSGSHTLALSVFGDPEQFQGRPPLIGGINPSGPASATFVSWEAGGTDLSARWHGFLGSFLLEGRYGYHEESSRDTSDGAHSLVILEVRSGLPQHVAGSGPYNSNDGGTFGLIDETYRRHVAELRGSLQLGNHDVKAGMGYELEDSERTRWFAGEGILYRYLRPNGAYNYSRSLYFTKMPLNCQMLTDGTTGNFGSVDPTTCKAWEPTDASRSTFQTRVATAFLQDRWQPLPNLTVNAGLRYDYETLSNSRGETPVKLTDQWSPRLSVAWDPTNRGQSRIHASYGRYYQMIPQQLQAWMMSQAYYADVFNKTPDRIDPVEAIYDYAFVYGEQYLPPDLKGTYQDEFVVGAEMRVGSNWTVGMRGVYRALGRALEDVCTLWDQRLDFTGLVPESASAHFSCYMANPGEPGALNQLKDPANPDCVTERNALGVATKLGGDCESVHARRYYRGLEFTVQHRPTKDLYLEASYVLSRLEGNYPGLITDPQVDGWFMAEPNINTDFDNADMLPNNYGRLGNDRTHQVKVSGSYAFPFGLTLGVVSQWANGRPLSLYSVVRPYGNFSHVVPRGSYGEMPWTYEIDLHLSYAFSVSGVSIIPVVDVFNVTDYQPALTRDQWYTRLPADPVSPPYTSPTHPNFGKDTSWQAPRLVRLGLRVVF